MHTGLDSIQTQQSGVSCACGTLPQSSQSFCTFIMLYRKDYYLFKESINLSFM